jgi:hypothetical protein
MKFHGVVFNSLSTGITLPYNKEYTLSDLVIPTLHEAQIIIRFSIKEVGEAHSTRNWYITRDADLINISWTFIFDIFPRLCDI